jgi:hypothetical protein
MLEMAQFSCTEELCRFPKNKPWERGCIYESSMKLPLASGMELPVESLQNPKKKVPGVEEVVVAELMYLRRELVVFR